MAADSRGTAPSNASLSCSSGAAVLAGSLAANWPAIMTAWAVGPAVTTCGVARMTGVLMRSTVVRGRTATPSGADHALVGAFSIGKGSAQAVAAISVADSAANE